MRTTIAAFAAAAWISAMGGAARAQSAVDLVKQSALQYAQGYANPLANMFSAIFNSGQYHTADTKGFHVYVSLQATGAFVPDAEKTFSPTFDYNTGNDPGLLPQLRNQTLHLHFTDAPTILGGSADDHYLIDTTINGQRYKYGPLPGGIGASFVPLIIPHIEIGSIAGTELLLRLMPSIQTNSDIGNVSFYGVGLRHSLSQYIPLLPIDVSAQLMYQHLAAGDVITMDAWNLALLGSVDLPVISVYGGVQLEQATMHLHYDFNALFLPETPVDLDLASTHNARFTLGATLKLFLFYVNAQFTVAPVSTFGGGIGIRIPPSL